MKRNLLLYVAVVFLLAGAARQATAAVTINVTQTGGNVLFDAAGTLNTTDLNSFGYGFDHARVHPNARRFMLGHAPGTRNFDIFRGFTSVPGDFGTGDDLLATTGTGDRFGISYFDFWDYDLLYVPRDFTGGSLSATNTYAGASLASIGLTPGSYVWTWGTGVNADSLTLNIKPIPAPGAILLGSIGVGFVSWLRRRRSL